MDKKRKSSAMPKKKTSRFKEMDVGNKLPRHVCSNIDMTQFKEEDSNH